MNMEIYLLGILQTKPMVVMSWGISKLRALQGDEGIIFHVQGLKFNGWVKVVYDLGEDLFNIFYIEDNDQTQKVQKSISVDQLVDTIDEAVEKTKDYESDVMRWIVLC